MRTSGMLVSGVISLGLLAGVAMAGTYYVDYTSGDDGKSGKTQGEAWKHAPGDPQAGGRAASAVLGAGDVVQFRGGVVYRGSVVVGYDGDEKEPLVYRGTGWGEGRAIVDGSETVAGWKKCASAADAGGNPNFANLYYTDVEASSVFDLNLMEQVSDGVEKFLDIAQSPNPENPFFNDRKDSFYNLPQTNLTTTSVTDPEVFTASDPDHYKGASLLLWVAPNVVRRVDILTFEPSSHRVTFEDIKASAIYTDGRDQAFAIFNSPHAIDRAGEYSVGLPDAVGKRRVILWPFDSKSLEAGIFRSVRENGFVLRAQNHVTIEGFVIQRFAGPEMSSGSGVTVGPHGKPVSSGLTVRDNVIRYNASGAKGEGGVYMTGVNGALVEKNEIYWNKGMRAIFFTRSENVIIRDNMVTHSGRTAIVMYSGKQSQILNNRIDSILATHANALTLYIACENVIVAGNVITNSTNPITFQDSGPLYFFNNVVDGGGKYKPVQNWPLTKRGPWAKGRIVFLNNTLINADKSSSLNLGSDSEVEHIVINNILDGLGVGKRGAKIQHTHNIYTGLNSFQGSRYGWEMGEGEIQVSDMNVLFQNPEKLDFRPRMGSPAIGAGVDVSQYYPKDVFPEVNFDAIAGVTKPMNIGAIGGPSGRDGQLPSHKK